MSIKVMTMVWDSDLKPNHKHVLHAYADRADDAGESVYPGEEEVAWKTSYSLPTVRRVTAELIALGAMERVKTGHRNQRAEYRISVEFLKASHNDRQSKAYQMASKSLSDGRESLSDGVEKPIASDMPNVSDPSSTSVIRQLVESDKPERTTNQLDHDALIAAVIEVHGQPATQTEWGKFHRAAKTLAEADVTPDEYSGLVAAYVSKHDGNQPAVLTVSQRVGEIRQYRDAGPMAKAALIVVAAATIDPESCSHKWADVEDTPEGRVGLCRLCRVERLFPVGELLTESEVSP